MKLTAFRIKNFRSIVDSNWNYFSLDGITALIGQNESGKTSVLEALRSFYDGVITDDILRSDLSIPWVACEFDAEASEITSVLQQYVVPQEVADCINKKRKIVLTRFWKEDKTSYIELSGEDINAYYTQLKEKNASDEALLMNSIEEFDKEGRHLEESLSVAGNELEYARKEYAKLEQQINEVQKSLQRSKTPEIRNQHQNQADQLQLSIEHSRLQIEQKSVIVDDLNNRYNQIGEKIKYSRMAKNSIQNIESTKQQIDLLLQQIQSIGQTIGHLSNNREIKATQQKLDQARQQNRQASVLLHKLRDDVIFNKTLASKVLQGFEYEEAKKMTIKELSTFSKMVSLVELGNAFFIHCPVFEMFEDFSSLLPNKIDLDDLLNENTTVEGYKAVRNFLTVAGIDTSFFDHQNNRILKQKIENLNGEVTINFQDFWRQNIGKNNKIKIYFELEHYDFNHPDKKGKPYLEFWIIDTRERLYPKQRSRGVRWFLSFYLELKAMAKLNKLSQVLLIDEPGISLHARAQEDVLKVFEDIKENLTIIYTTHSPHLIDINKLYRILPVQRAIEDDDSSETIIFDVRSLSKASADTLSPIYSLMGARFNDQQFIHKFNNIIVEDNITYYFLSALFKLCYPEQEIYILPSTDLAHVPTLANLLIGWRLDFIVLLSNSQKSKLVYKELREKLFADNEQNSDRHIVSMEQKRNVVDYFSTIDFKNFILHQRVGITESNSEYAENNGLSLTLLAMDFMNAVFAGKVNFNDFDDETKTNIQVFLKKIVERIQ
jgi:AAA15 family ATPase/GTPase